MTIKVQFVAEMGDLGLATFRTLLVIIIMMMINAIIVWNFRNKGDSAVRIDNYGGAWSWTVRGW